MGGPLDAGQRKGGWPLTREEIDQNLRRVGHYLDEQRLVGEIMLVGGAYMTLVLQRREATKDVDAYFATHADAIRRAAIRVSNETGLPPDWLNDAVKGFFYSQPETTLWLECPGLRVYAPSPDYIFAMKAFAGRPEDLRDLASLRARAEFVIRPAGPVRNCPVVIVDGHRAPRHAL